MVRLFYVPRTRATRPRMVLEELGLPHELVRLDAKAGETRTTDHLARHPLGHVPALEDGEVRLFESGAICLYLAERYGDGKLLPPAGSPGRALAYQWLCFALSELEPAVSIVSDERKRPEADRDERRIEEARKRFRTAAQAVADVVAEQPYLLGAEVSAVDFVVAAILSWGKSAAGLEGIPAAEGYVKRMRERPSWGRATAD
jgi:glutathione S-transferase